MIQVGHRQISRLATIILSKIWPAPLNGERLAA